jgi:hypothetical protein
MRWKLLLLSLLLIALSIPQLIAVPASADPTTLAKPIYTEVFTRAVGDGRSQEITGNLIRYDDQTVAIKTSTGERQVNWISLTATSAFTLRSRLIDKKVATDWLELGRFGWSIAAREQARLALGTASRMDPTLKAQVQAILASPPGAALTASPTADPGGRELLVPAPTTQAGGTTAGSNLPHAFGMLPRPPDNSPLKPTLTYEKSTAAQNMLAIAEAKLRASEVSKEFDVTFYTLETDHFLIFTDWDPREYDFLKTNFEEAYATVSRQFEIPATDNVFVGKLPVYMFAHFHTFAKLTDSLGFLGQPAPRTLRGYFAGEANGSGRMVMYKPGADDVDEAEKEWAHCLVHEFTHAFVARYRTNAKVPRWLNEGIAEVIAAKNFPFPGTYPYAMRMAHEHRDAVALFDDDKMPSGEWYPVMQTMVELLIAQDHTAFKKMFDAIKAGTDGEAALKKYYGIDYDQLMAHWRQAILHR